MAMKALSKATIYQVARAAGVSIATVSRALRGSELVTDETRERVLAAARELQFTPSRLGRSLAEGRHAANGIVFPDLVGPYYAEVVLGYEAVAAGFGSSVLILATRGRADAEAAVRDLASRVDGLTVMGQTVSDEVIGKLAATGLPMVLLAREPVPGVDTVRAQNRTTAQELVAHLLGHGHRRFTFLGDPDGAPDVKERYAGVRAGLAKAGAEPAVLVRGPGFDLEAGRRAARELGGEPQAVICANDELALGVLLERPDATVTGWDDLLAAQFAGLTTVRQPMRELGATAARWLNRRITENRPGSESRHASERQSGSESDSASQRHSGSERNGASSESRRGSERNSERESGSERSSERQSGGESDSEGSERNQERNNAGKDAAARRRILPTRLVVRSSCGTHSPEVHR